MKRLLLFTVVIGSLCSCEHKGPTLYEKGVVVDKQYVPATTGTGTGVSTNGHLYVYENESDEKYTIFFKCEHQRIFPAMDKEAWQTLQKGDSVNIEYREVFLSDGRFKEYEYINATKIAGNDTTADAFCDGEGNPIPPKAIHALVNNEFVYVSHEDSMLLHKYFYVKH